MWDSEIFDVGLEVGFEVGLENGAVVLEVGLEIGIVVLEVGLDVGTGLGRFVGDKVLTSSDMFSFIARDDVVGSFVVKSKVGSFVFKTKIGFVLGAEEMETSLFMTDGV